MPPRKSKIEAVTDFASTFKEWLGIKTQTQTLAKRQKQLKDRMVAQMERDAADPAIKHVYLDEKGSYYVDFPEGEVDGFKGIQWRCVPTSGLDEERAEKILKEKGILEQCTIMVPELDQEAINAAHYEGIISQEELDEIFVKSTTYAFWPRPV